jgi:hypothetical protein
MVSFECFSCACVKAKEADAEARQAEVTSHQSVLSDWPEKSPDDEKNMTVTFRDEKMSNPPKAVTFPIAPEGPAPDKGVEMVFASEGTDHVVSFTRRPIGLIFNFSFVVEVANDANRKLGVQVGSVLKSIDGSDLSGMTRDQIEQLLVPVVEKLPLDEILQNGLRIVFESNGEQHAVSFTEKPIGVSFSRQLPLVVMATNDVAKELGVQEGWVVKSISDMTITGSDLTYAQVSQFLVAYVKYLPNPTKVSFNETTQGYEDEDEAVRGA